MCACLQSQMMIFHIKPNHAVCGRKLCHRGVQVLVGFFVVKQKPLQVPPEKRSPGLIQGPQLRAHSFEGGNFMKGFCLGG